MYFWGQSTKDQGHRFKRCIFGVNLPKIKVIVLKDVFLGSIYQRSRSSFLKDVFLYKPSPNLYIYAGGVS
jgi:hypothetical protein